MIWCVNEWALCICSYKNGTFSLKFWPVGWELQILDTTQHRFYCTEIRDNICNMIYYSGWLKLNSVHKKKFEHVINKNTINFRLPTSSFQDACARTKTTSRNRWNFNSPSAMNTEQLIVTFQTECLLNLWSAWQGHAEFNNMATYTRSFWVRWWDIVVRQTW
jgi:hypothetical protein